MLTPPELSEDKSGGVIIASYVIPSATLTVAPRANGDYYNVKFMVWKLYNIA